MWSSGQGKVHEQLLPFLGPDYVIERYRSGKGKGWGALAQSLGIKPGSKEFHDLKRGSDMYDDDNRGKGKGKARGQGKGRGRTS